MKKRDAKLLRELAETLPVLMYETREKHLVKGEDLIAQGRTHVGENDEIEVKPDDLILDEFPVRIAVNHYKALKNIFKKGGIAAMNMYCDIVHKNHVTTNSK